MSSASSSARAPSALAKVEATVDKVETQLLAVEQKLERGQVDLNDTPARYAGYGARLRTLVLGYNRYLAYASDAGEGFRPVVSPLFVRATYGISWSYLLGDVAYEGYKSSLLAEEFGVEGKGSVVGLTVAKRALFQGTASMLLPAFTIHSIVKYSAKAIKRSSIQSARARLWLPTLLGLSVVPALPYMFDEPVEHVVDKIFDLLHGKFVHDPATLKALHGNVHEKEL